MTPEQFAYWFQGFAELSPTPPTQEQWDSMREHVATVFRKVTPKVAPALPIPPAPMRSPLEDAIARQRDAGWPYNPWPHAAPVITC